jgi:hypothetical protein
MSPPEEKLPLASFVQEEMIENLSDSLARLLGTLPSVARLRLLAFMHLVENPDTMRATLEIDPAGALRLTLDTMVAPSRTHQH